MAWLFGKKQTKAINSKAKVANKEVMQAIQDLENYKFDLQANISWWYNGANKESLARQLNDYSTGQLKRLEQWVERFNEAISILKDNQYSKLCDIKTENATIRSIIRNNDFIKWCKQNDKPVDKNFEIFSRAYTLFNGDNSIAELMLCKQPWKHADKWQVEWCLKTNYHTWSNEFGGFTLFNYRQNIINGLHTEALIEDCVRYSGVKLNKTNTSKFNTVMSQIKDIKNVEVSIKNELGKYTVLVGDIVLTGYTKEATALKLKQDVDIMINYLKGEC